MKALRFFKLIIISSVLGISLGIGHLKLKKEYLKYKKELAVYKDLKIRQNIKNNTVMVLLRNGSGSGIVIRSDSNGTFIVTNKHVCNPISYKNLKIKSRFDTTSYATLIVKPVGDADKTKPLFFTAQVMEVAQNYDLCLLYTDTYKFDSVPIGKDPPLIGDKLYAYSNPYGFPGVFSEGEAGFSIYVEDSIYQMSSVYAQPGSSGSGVFNTSGELIGIVTLVDSRNTYMVPLSHIIHFTGKIVNQ